MLAAENGGDGTPDTGGPGSTSAASSEWNGAMAGRACWNSWYWDVTLPPRFSTMEMEMNTMPSRMMSTVDVTRSSVRVIPESSRSRSRWLRSRLMPPPATMFGR